MPELPEVESFRKFIEKTSLHKSIHVVKLASKNMLSETKEKELIKALQGNSFEHTFRHGKFLFMKLAKGGNLMLHFGLTGDVEYAKAGEDHPEKFALHLHFDDDSSFFFTDTRKMGKIALVEDVDAFIEQRKYGPDALKIKMEDFIGKVGKKRVAVKTVLMDQKVVAGVGNEFSDEILFRAKVHPASPAVALPAKKLTEIYDLMISILKESVKVNSDRSKLEKYYFLDNRKAGLACPSCKGKTSVQTIGGRSSYFCSRCQKVYKTK